MNPGYLAFLLIIVTLILLASGWQDSLCRGVSPRALLLFFIAWISLSYFEVELPGFGRINLCLCLIVFLCIYVFVTTKQASGRLHLFIMGLVLAMTYFTMKQLLSLAPLLIVYRSQLDVCLMMSAATFIFLRDPLQQMAAISCGLLFGTISSELYLHGAPNVMIGGAVFQDEWWLTVLATRGMSLAVQCTSIGWKEAALLIHERKKGWRK